MKRLKSSILLYCAMNLVMNSQIVHANIFDWFNIDITKKEEAKEQLKEGWETTKSKTRQFTHQLLEKLKNELSFNEYLVPDFIEFNAEDGEVANVIVIDKLGLHTEIYFGIKEIEKSYVKKVTQYRYEAPLLPNKHNIWTFNKIIDTKPITTSEYYTGNNAMTSNQYLLHNEQYYVEAEVTLHTTKQKYTLPVPVAYEDFLQLKQAGSSAVGTRIYPLFLEK